jgi:hypothetical protein
MPIGQTTRGKAHTACADAGLGINLSAYSVASFSGGAPSRSEVNRFLVEQPHDLRAGTLLVGRHNIRKAVAIVVPDNVIAARRANCWPVDLKVVGGETPLTVNCVGTHRARGQYKRNQPTDQCEPPPCHLLAPPTKRPNQPSAFTYSLMSLIVKCELLPLWFSALFLWLVTDTSAHAPKADTLAHWRDGKV